MVATAMVATACGSSAANSGSSPTGDTVTVGEATALSGAVADFGQTGLNGIKLAVDDINAQGGLLGKKVKVKSADTAAKPDRGATSVRSMILDDKAAALFGPVSSAVGAAEEAVAAARHVPIFFYVSNDVGLMNQHYTKYGFQLVPNTVMEPQAIARAMADKVGGKTVKLATITPDYSFGRDTVSAFLDALRKDGVKFTVTTQQTPPLGSSDLSSYISALIASNPDYVFVGQYSGDLVTFTKQAAGFGLFSKTKVLANYDYGTLKALGSQAPVGAMAWDRAPFWAMPAVAKFTTRYHDKYGDYPSEWAIMGYTAVQTWAQGVKRANSFGADKVSAALSGGATVSTIRGHLTLRGCDHQAQIPEYVGTVAASGNPQYGGAQLWGPSVFTAKSDQILPPCKNGG
ncbi:MAG: ABC transporter substrate-binding protein [Sciscionella sp.]